MRGRPRRPGVLRVALPTASARRARRRGGSRWSAIAGDDRAVRAGDCPRTPVADRGHVVDPARPRGVVVVVRRRQPGRRATASARSSAPRRPTAGSTCCSTRAGTATTCPASRATRPARRAADPVDARGRALRDPGDARAAALALGVVGRRRGQGRLPALGLRARGWRSSTTSRATPRAQHLVVAFHGCTIPRGIQRTWPNVLTLEAVEGAERETPGQGSQAMDPRHDVDLAFTRNAIGSMDYTPVTFSARNRAAPTRTGSRSRSSTSPGSSTSPTRRRATPQHPQARQLLRDLPTAWDDVRLLAGAPDREVGSRGARATAGGSARSRPPARTRQRSAALPRPPAARTTCTSCATTADGGSRTRTGR